MKFVTGAFLGSCACAQDKLTDREVKPVIIGRLGGSGMSCTSKSIGSVGCSLITQIYSPLSINLTGLKYKLKFFGFNDLWKRTGKDKKNRQDLNSFDNIFFMLEFTCQIAVTLTLWFCSNGLPFINFIIVWLDFQVNFSILETDFSPTTPAQGKVKLVPARATIFFRGRLSASVWCGDKWGNEMIEKCYF